ncbi:unnamed protein product [Mycena citricolor]|uniref:Uncharacterized protein n=1 Tax=Mycena citricolor TaxID=2018698 RepID=A0AAD2JVG8_9AGAR|nr:unnamed protein product [Mycena citricolor]
MPVVPHGTPASLILPDLALLSSAQLDTEYRRIQQSIQNAVSERDRQLIRQGFILGIKRMRDVLPVQPPVRPSRVARMQDLAPRDPASVGHQPHRPANAGVSSAEAAVGHSKSQVPLLPPVWAGLPMSPPPKQANANGNAPGSRATAQVYQQQHPHRPLPELPQSHPRHHYENFTHAAHRREECASRRSRDSEGKRERGGGERDRERDRDRARGTKENARAREKERDRERSRSREKGRGQERDKPTPLHGSSPGSLVGYCRSSDRTQRLQKGLGRPADPPY